VFHIKKKTNQLVIFLVFFCSILAGQELRFKIEQITPKQGLSQSTVTSILQDKYGFMWFGTWNGLNKYNGYDFIVYKPEIYDTSSISNNVIRSIFEDRYGLLWIGTEFGLNSFNQDTEKFEHYLYNEEDTLTISNNIVLSIIEDSKYNLWLGTKEGGLCRFDREKNIFYRFYNEHSPESNCIYILAEDHLNNNFIWLGTEQGLFKFDKENETFISYVPKSDEKSHIGISIRALSQDKEGNIYIGSWGEGLLKYNRKSHKIIKHFDARNISLLKYNYIFTMLMDVQDVLWIGTRDGGLVKLNTLNDQISYPSDYFPSNTLNSKVIKSLYKSNSNILWVGTKYYGINKVVPNYKKFKVYRNVIADFEDMNKNVITSIYTDSDRILWLGTLKSGLCKFNKASGKCKVYTHDPYNPWSISSNNIKKIIAASENNREIFWIGTDGGGLNKFYPASGTFVRYLCSENNANSLSNNHIYSLLEYDSEHLLIGSWGSNRSGGLDIFNYKTRKFINLKNNTDSKNSISSNVVLEIYKDKTGVLWIGTKGGGLNKLVIKNIDGQEPEEIGEFTRYIFETSNLNSVSNNDIFSIYEDEDYALWIGTGGGGLNKFDRSANVFTHFTEEDGLANNIIYGILEDENHNLWLSTDNGISKFSTLTKEFNNYDKKDGLQDNVFSLGASFKSKSGELYFGGVNGCSSFCPDSIKVNIHIPEIAITKLLIGKKDKVYNAQTYTNKSLTTLQEIKLPYYLNDISFEFAALEYSSPLKNKYKYKLEGYDPDWIETDATRRFANYTNLKYGKYLFKVIASNEDGNWNEEGTSVAVVILHPLWRNIWFMLSLIIIATAVFVFFVVKWIKKYKQERFDLEKKVQESILDERNQLRTLIDNLPDTIYIKDRQSRFIVGNKKVAAVMGTVPKNLVGKTDFDFYTYDLASRFYNDEQTIIKTGKPKINYEEPGLDEQGNRIIKSTTKVPLKNKNGEVVGLVGIGRDITRLKNTEKELRKKSEDLQETNQLLEERQEQIQQQSEELTTQTENLKRVNTELERLNKTKDKFFSIIAHDLKNPFHAIIGFSELLRKDFEEMDDQQKISLLELINVSSESAFSLLENLLQWARTQTDKIKYTPENIDICEVIKSNIDFHKISAEKKKIKLKSHIDTHNIVHADKNMITTVIRNLVSNAIKFTKINGRIDIMSSDSEKYLEITISDNGIGIDKDNLDKLFRIDSYYSTSGTLGESGTGLGLIICKEFVEKNGGKINVKSEKGKGCAFTFSLPVAKNLY